MSIAVAVRTWTARTLMTVAAVLAALAVAVNRRAVERDPLPAGLATL
jgi:hypothetical protein